MFKRVSKTRIYATRSILYRKESSGPSVYIHWPYCTKLCSYCNFNKYVARSVDHHRMLSSLLAEWRHLSSKLEVSSANTIFFGGGTPSLMELNTIETLVREISGGKGDIEVSLEGNPGDLLGKISSLQSAGVTRLSVGVQALNDKDLLDLNRDHTVAQALECLHQCLATFPRSISADLLIGRPGQSVSDCLDEAEKLASLGISHLSLYQLTVERGTRLAKQVTEGQIRMLDEEVMADMYLALVECIERAGLVRYEVSNFSVPGRECKHNIGYWSGGEYIGLGPGAHSRVAEEGKRRARVNTPLPEHWMVEVERKGHGVRVDKVMNAKESLAELLASGLRRDSGISRENWEKASKGFVEMEDFYRVMEHQGLGMVMSNESLRLEREKIVLVDHILPYLMVALDELELKECD